MNSYPINEDNVLSLADEAINIYKARYILDDTAITRPRKLLMKIASIHNSMYMNQNESEQLDETSAIALDKLVTQLKKEKERKDNEQFISYIANTNMIDYLSSILCKHDVVMVYAYTEALIAFYLYYMRVWNPANVQKMSQKMNQDSYMDLAYNHAQKCNENCKGSWKTKLRDIYNLSLLIHNSIIFDSQKEFAPHTYLLVNKLRVKLKYERGRDKNKDFQTFIDCSQLIEMVDWIEHDKDRFLLVHNYLEALLASMYYFQGKRYDNTKSQDYGKFEGLTEETYVSFAFENVRKCKQYCKDSSQSKLRNIYNSSLDIYHSVTSGEHTELRKEESFLMNRLIVRLMYEYGRDNNFPFQQFINSTYLIDIARWIERDRNRFLLFHYYLEALVAFFR